MNADWPTIRWAQLNIGRLSPSLSGRKNAMMGWNGNKYTPSNIKGSGEHLCWYLLSNILSTPGTFLGSLCCPGRSSSYFRWMVPKLKSQRPLPWTFSIKLPSCECHWTSIIHQYWFRQWLGAVRQQVIARTNVDPDLCRHKASLDHNEFIN